MIAQYLKGGELKGARFRLSFQQYLIPVDQATITISLCPNSSLLSFLLPTFLCFFLPSSPSFLSGMSYAYIHFIFDGPI